PALTVRLCNRVLGADDASFGPVMGKRGEAGAAAGPATTGAGASSSSYVDNNQTPTMPVNPSDDRCFCLHHLLKHPGRVQGAVMCDNASPGCGTCACATPPHRYGRLGGACRSPGTCGRRCLVLMGGQKDLQGTPS